MSCSASLTASARRSSPQPRPPSNPYPVSWTRTRGRGGQGAPCVEIEGRVASDLPARDSDAGLADRHRLPWGESGNAASATRARTSAARAGLAGSKNPRHRADRAATRGPARRPAGRLARGDAGLCPPRTAASRRAAEAVRGCRWLAVLPVGQKPARGHQGLAGAQRLPRRPPGPRPNASTRSRKLLNSANRPCHQEGDPRDGGTRPPDATAGPPSYPNAKDPCPKRGPARLSTSHQPR
jgi:hypothetical protein